MKTVKDNQYLIKYRHGKTDRNLLFTSITAANERVSQLKANRRKILFVGPAKIVMSYNDSQNMLD